VGYGLSEDGYVVTKEKKQGAKPIAAITSGDSGLRQPLAKSLNSRGEVNLAYLTSR
jgi:hypothetical protein